MGRKITMTGRNAQYVEHRGVNATPDGDREIRMEGEKAVYTEYAYGQPAAREKEEPAAGEPADTRLLPSVVAECVEPISEEDCLERLKPIFYNNEADARLFMKEVAGMQPNDITDLVNRWVQEKRISDYGYSRKGALWSILNDAGIYKKSRQNWNRRVF
jgi:hypothetical protein